MAFLGGDGPAGNGLGDGGGIRWPVSTVRGTAIWPSILWQALILSNKAVARAVRKLHNYLARPPKSSDDRDRAVAHAALPGHSRFQLSKNNLLPKEARRWRASIGLYCIWRGGVVKDLG